MRAVDVGPMQLTHHFIPTNLLHIALNLGRKHRRPFLQADARCQFHIFPLSGLIWKLVSLPKWKSYWLLVFAMIGLSHRRQTWRIFVCKSWHSWVDRISEGDGWKKWSSSCMNFTQQSGQKWIPGARINRCLFVIRSEGFFNIHCSQCDCSTHTECAWGEQASLTMHWKIPEKTIGPLKFSAWDWVTPLASRDVKLKLYP